jgi:metal-responsive CopG/Arc/MetJ family transcriptional regulator
MPAAIITISIEHSLLRGLDRLVERRVFCNRSAAIQTAVSEKLARYRRFRLAGECAKLDPREEQAFAETILTADLVSWPEY